MKNILMIAGIAVGMLLLLIGSCSYMVYSSYEGFPDYAEKDVVYEKYSGLIADLDSCISESSGVLDLAARLEKLNYPPEVIYVALEKDVDFKNRDQKMLDIIKKFDKGSKSTFTMNGTGYGSINGQDIIIIKHEVDKFPKLEEVILYLEYHEEPEE